MLEETQAQCVSGAAEGRQAAAGPLWTLFGQSKDSHHHGGHSPVLLGNVTLGALAIYKPG